MHCAALIVAAGSGQRFGDDRPKQYAKLAGMSVLRRSVRRFAEHAAVDAVVVAIGKDHRDLYDASVSGLANLLPPVIGGSNRQSSVLIGLEQLTSIGPKLVLVHDAARPLASPALVDRVVALLDEHEAVVPALPVVDTIKKRSGRYVEQDVARDQLVRMQTPQGFDFAKILAAHRQSRGGSMTDDAAVARAAGIDVAMVEGEESNFKITVGEDLNRAERLLAQSYAYRTGSGFDVHAFGAKRPLLLCGVDVKHTIGLHGHSDADVGLHALTDALLATIAAGDIGALFPPNDDRWKNADSALFLDEARQLVAGQGAAIEHVDVTLICEQPKIGPYRDAMRDRIAAILKLDRTRVSVKATTTEQLGFTGRGEGIAAQALATVRLPVNSSGSAE